MNCDLCNKKLSKEKGELDHGCLNCAGYLCWHDKKTDTCCWPDKELVMYNPHTNELMIGYDTMWESFIHVGDL